MDKLTERIIRIEGKLDNILENIQDIKQNHLVYIYKKMGITDEKMAVQKPTIKFLNKIGEYLIMAVIISIITRVLK